MTDKVDKPKKKAAAKKEEKGVLAALPTTRPERIGTRRASATKPKPAPAAKKPATAARRKAAAPRTFEPTAAAESAAGAADERAAGAVPRAETPPVAAEAKPRAAPEPKPRAVREGAPGMGTSGAHERAPASAGRGDERSEAVSPEHGRPSGVELVSTAVQAAGELAQIGLSIGGRILKRAVDRLPKP